MNVFFFLTGPPLAGNNFSFFPLLSVSVVKKEKIRTAGKAPPAPRRIFVKFQQGLWFDVSAWPYTKRPTIVYTAPSPPRDIAPGMLLLSVCVLAQRVLAAANCMSMQV